MFRSENATPVPVGAERPPAVIIMSPDRFWCQGAGAVSSLFARYGATFHYTHSLASLKLILIRHRVSFILMKKYGDGENMIDWFIFSQWMRQRFPGLPVVELCHTDEEYASGNSRGCMAAASSVRELRYLFGRISLGRFQAPGISYHEPRLTPRERYILYSLCLGERPVTLGKRLGISTKTISSHKTSALEKLGLTGLSLLAGRGNVLHRALLGDFPGPD